MEAEHPHQITYTTSTSSLCPRRRKRGDEEAAHHLVFPMDLDSAAAAAHQQQQQQQQTAVREEEEEVEKAPLWILCFGGSQDKLKALAYEYGHEFRVFSSATFEAMTSNLPEADQDTVPPKKRIKDTSLDFYTIGFVPGANVYFSYDLPEGDDEVRQSGRQEYTTRGRL
uniref:Uncharacterized protein n=1 Tax=Oryza meridionalis TaxID=40149 RepID=A0A0E0DFD3_9ORYZ